MKSNRLLSDSQPLKSLKNCDIRIYEIIHLKWIDDNLARKSNRKKSANHNSWQPKETSDD